MGEATKPVSAVGEQGAVNEAEAANAPLPHCTFAATQRPILAALKAAAQGRRSSIVCCHHQHTVAPHIALLQTRNDAAELLVEAGKHTSKSIAAGVVEGVGHHVAGGHLHWLVNGLVGKIYKQRGVDVVPIDNAECVVGE